MISYAQNFEDVILERIFKGQAAGFYVDIGACHPLYDSVTQHFYAKGWSGINVEPQPELFAELQAVRDRDINLQVCVGAEAGSGVLAMTKDIGTSTLNTSIADTYRSEGKVEQELAVEIVTLNHIWERHVGERQVDFMKIDVEGFEAEVLSGADFSRVAPSVLIIEATLPNSPIPLHDQWEHLLLDHYEFFYFDGLNRFYARKGFDFDRAACCVPPNVFDDIQAYPQVLLEQESENLRLENEDLKKQLEAGLAQLARKEAALSDASAAYAGLQGEEMMQHRQLEEATAAAAGYRAEIASVQQAYDALAAAYEKKEKDLQALQHAEMERCRQMEQAAEAASGYQAEIAKTRRTYDALMAAYEKKEKDLLDALDLIQEKDVDLAELSSLCESVQNQLETRDEALREALWTLKGKDADLQDASLSYEALQAEHARGQEEASRLRESLNAALDNCRRAEAAYKSLRTQFDEKLAELEATQGILAKKESDLRLSVNASEEMGRTLADAQSRLQDLHDGGAAHQALQEITAYNASLLEEIQRKECALVDAAQAYHSLRAAFDEKIRICDELGGAVERAQSQLRELGELYAATNRSLGEATAYNASLIEERQQRDRALLEATQAYHSLREEFDEKIRELEVLHERLSTPPGAGGK